MTEETAKAILEALYAIDGSLMFLISGVWVIVGTIFWKMFVGK